jgi:hypothetical protein
MGFLTGLGQGLQQFGGAMAQGRQLDEQARQRALERSLAQEHFEAQMRLQEEAAARAADEQEYRRNFQVASNLPEGTELPPEIAASWQRSGLSPFMRGETSLGSRDFSGAMPQPQGDFSFGVPELLNAPLGQQGPGGPTGEGKPMGPGGTPELLAGAVEPGKPTGKMLSVPTEDSKARTATSNREATQARVAYIYQQKASIADAANRLKAQIEEAKLKDPNRLKALQIQAGSLQQRWAQLDLEGKKFDANETYRYDVVMPDLIHDNALNDYKAENPATGARSAGSVSAGDAIAKMTGAAPAAAAPAAPEAPAAKRPPVPKTPSVGPKLDATKQNSHGDTIRWDGSQWVLQTPAKGKGGGK